MRGVDGREQAGRVGQAHRVTLEVADERVAVPAGGLELKKSAVCRWASVRVVEVVLPRLFTSSNWAV